MNIADILPLLLIDAPECPDIVATNALISATRDFCDQSNAWNEIQDPFTIIDNTDIYDIDVPSDGLVVMVMDAWSPTYQLTGKSMEQISQLLPNWQKATGSQPIYFSSQPASGEIRLFPMPLNAQRLQLTMRVSYKPTRTATTIDDGLLDDYQDALLAGARAKLMMQPGKAWSNPQLAQMNGQLFAREIVNARITIDHDRAPGTIIARPARPFGM